MYKERMNENMLKRMKKLSAMLLAATITLGTIGGTTSVLANNYTDSDFTFPYGTTMQYTTARLKTDDSKMYMKCNSVSVNNASYTAHAIGTNSTSVIGTDCSKGYTYKFGAGTSYYMTNWVNENGYTYGRIGAAPNYSYGFTAKGVWSPDNYNEY